MVEGIMAGETVGWMMNVSGGKNCWNLCGAFCSSSSLFGYRITGGRNKPLFKQAGKAEQFSESRLAAPPWCGSRSWTFCTRLAGLYLPHKVC